MQEPLKNAQLSIAQIDATTAAPEVIEKYENHGFLVHAHALDAQHLVELRRAVEETIRYAVRQVDSGKTYELDGKRFVDTQDTTVQFEHSPGSNTARVIEPVHSLHPKLDELVDFAPITRIMKILVGTPSLALWTAKLNVKRAYEGSGFGWHQDSPYWVHDSDHVDLLPNVMITLDDQNTNNGCFEIIKRSHIRGILPGTNDGSQLGGFFTDPNEFDEQQRIQMTLPAGSLIFFSPHCVHGSQPNNAEYDRRALIFTYQPGGHRLLKLDEIRDVG